MARTLKRLCVVTFFFVALFLSSSVLSLDIVYADTVDSSPQVIVSADPATGIEPLTVDFTCESSTGNEPLSYGWEFGDGTVSTIQNPEHIYESSGTFTAVCTATDVDGDAESGTTTVTVEADTTPQVTISAVPASGIEPLDVQFFSSVVGGNPPLTFEWDFDGDGIIDSTLQNPSFTYTTGDSFTAKLRVTDADGDSTTAATPISVAKTDELFPIIFNFPGPDVSAVTDPSTMEFSFNPEKYIVLKSTSGKQDPKLEFTIGEPMKMNLELFFDTYEEKTDVSKFTDKIQSLAQVSPDKHKPSPCLFTWGSMQFKCVLQSYSTTFTKFLEDGTPVRAIMNVKFKEVIPADKHLNSYTLKKKDALELLDATKESLPLLNSYQANSFHDVVDQFFGDLEVQEDISPIDQNILEVNQIQPLSVTDQDSMVTVKGFKVEIKGNNQGKSVDNSWETISGGSLRIEVTDSSVGHDQFHTTTPGHKFVEELVLVGPLTDTRKPLVDWVLDGSLDKCKKCKNVAISFFDDNGNTIFQNDIRVLDAYYFRNQVFLISIQEDNRLHATVLDIKRTDSGGNPYLGPPRIFVVLPTSSPAFMPVVIGGSGFADASVQFTNNVPSVQLFDFSTQNIPLIGSISVGVTIIPPAAPQGAGSVKVEYLGQQSNPFPFSVN